MKLDNNLVSFILNHILAIPYTHKYEILTEYGLVYGNSLFTGTAKISSQITCMRLKILFFNQVISISIGAFPWLKIINPRSKCFVRLPSQ